MQRKLNAQTFLMRNKKLRENFPIYGIKLYPTPDLWTSP